LFATACRSTITQTELNNIATETQGNTFPGKLTHESESEKYDYYRIETELGIYGKYQVLKTETSLKSRNK
jgi:hypothetical protein